MTIQLSAAEFRHAYDVINDAIEAAGKRGVPPGVALCVMLRICGGFIAHTEPEELRHAALAQATADLHFGYRFGNGYADDGAPKERA